MPDRPDPDPTDQIDAWRRTLAGQVFDNEPGQAMTPDEEADFRLYLPSMSLDTAGLYVPSLLATLDALRVPVGDDSPSPDAAWAAVEAALPEGYAIMLRGSNDWMGRGPTWKVDAYHSDGRRKARHVEADTPAAALLALAARLAEPTP
jgi:hypothetical protein